MPERLTVHELALKYGVSREAIHYLIRKYKIPHSTLKLSPTRSVFLIRSQIFEKIIICKMSYHGKLYKLLFSHPIIR